MDFADIISNEKKMAELKLFSQFGGFICEIQITFLFYHICHVASGSPVARIDVEQS